MWCQAAWTLKGTLGSCCLRDYCGPCRPVAVALYMYTDIICASRFSTTSGVDCDGWCSSTRAALQGKRLLACSILKSEFWYDQLRCTCSLPTCGLYFFFQLASCYHAVDENPIHSTWNKLKQVPLHELACYRMEKGFIRLHVAGFSEAKVRCVPTCMCCITKS